MRLAAAIALAVGLALPGMSALGQAAGGSNASAPGPTGALPTEPPDGAIGFRAHVASRNPMGCQIRLTVVNRSGRNIRTLFGQAEVYVRDDDAEVAHFHFDLLDNGRSRRTDLLALHGCERNPRIVIRSLTCWDGPLPDGCDAEVVPLESAPAPNSRAERTRMAVQLD